MSRHGSPGQASIEAIAAGPVIVICVVVAWQLATLVRGAILAEERLGAAPPAAGARGSVTVTSAVDVPSLVPGAGPLRIAVRGVVRAP